MSLFEKSFPQGKPLIDQASAPDASKRESLAGWIDSRTGLVTVTQSLMQWQVPKYVERNLLYSLGGLTLIALIFQFFTGLCLTFYYDPGIEAAYDSVDFVTYQVPLGWLVRSIHHYNASAVVILIFLHLLRTFFFSAYKRPREVTWLSGVVLFLITLGFGFTGYLLPWDQKGYWATTVGTEIAGQVPLIGGIISKLLRGGADLGQLTLTRFYVTHVALLPLSLVLFVLLHLQQQRFHGIAPNLRQHNQTGKTATVPFFPNWVNTTLLLGLGLLAVLIFLSWQERAPLAFPANPADTDYNPKPEWYFLFLFELLHYAPGSLEPLLIVLVPLVVIGSMVLLPFLDRGEERRPWRKPITTSIALFYVIVIVVFTYLGW